jgi:ATP-dependent HslUV protease ATP-binding subunit HslU
MTTENLTPKNIVAELDRFIIGQNKAKRAVALALRNRWRRKQVASPLREEITPKNILMIGPTGVGKTEIARRIAKLVDAPFIKVEATKFTEVGYVGRDVDSIIRDLTDAAISLVRERNCKIVEEKAHAIVEERILDALVGASASAETRDKFLQKLRAKSLEEKEIDIELQDQSAPPGFNSFDFPGGQMGVLNLSDMMNKALGPRAKIRRVTVAEARSALLSEESEKLIDQDRIIKDAISLVEEEGIVFIDEIDKVSARHDVRGGEVSREGVQRDLLPLLEGSVVSTKHGPVRTDYILFIASGAFHIAKPSDLLPELQGRLPIRVELQPLTRNDLIRILREPESSLLKQYSALLATENLSLTFTDDAVEAIADLAQNVNQNVENIGARRLHTIMEKLLEEISFSAPDSKKKKLEIDKDFVNRALKDLTTNTDLSKFIL